MVCFRKITFNDKNSMEQFDIQHNQLSKQR